ncbi:MAG TPA: bifunctional hydroxymethylpyrimidine kinase/phosphomethylpyrimidine kinase [Myxococcales bacterium]|nr:bifunctional hydroxymethylpyrimidine kinase/phosphomethylpyrimidine kinase [Myxococcales bacterium]HIK85579.1 bifunctional hydroxymethylpyrimidine kinase/phosphomethylpyrimidine kinase [Myxococcales bacterium]
MQSVLSIAGSDPTGGAGLQADLQVFHAHGVHGAAVPTALTIQDGLRIGRVLPVFPSVLLEQLRATLDVLRPNAIKIGMLATDDIVRNVLLSLARFPEIPVVIDPILAASDGSALLEKRAYPALRDLIQGRRILTPNWPEAEILVDASLPRRKDGEAAARELLLDLNLDAVLLKGGHLEGDCDDLLVYRKSADSSSDSSNNDAEIVCEWLPGKRLPGPPVHGTGCALSAAIAAGLAQGQSIPDAVVQARRFVRRAIENAQTLGNGARILAFQ